MAIFPATEHDIAHCSRFGNGASCLMYVASNGKPDLVKLLLGKGANPRLKNFDDFSALDLAASLECLKLLRKAA